MSWEGSLVFNNVLRTLNLDCRASLTRQGIKPMVVVARL